MKKIPHSLPVQLQKLEQSHRRVVIVNRVLMGALFLTALGLGADLVHGLSVGNPPVPPVRPPLAKLRAPLATIPSLDLPPALFHLEKQSEPTQGSQAPRIAPEAEWKVVGVSLGAMKRAFLQDADGKKSIWVTEGEQFGIYRVKEIRERSVVLEANGSSYEIRM